MTHDRDGREGTNKYRRGTIDAFSSVVISYLICILLSLFDIFSLKIVTLYTMYPCNTLNHLTYPIKARIYRKSTFRQTRDLLTYFLMETPSYRDARTHLKIILTRVVFSLFLFKFARTDAHSTAQMPFDIEQVRIPDHTMLLLGTACQNRNFRKGVTDLRTDLRMEGPRNRPRAVASIKDVTHYSFSHSEHVSFSKETWMTMFI